MGQSHRAARLVLGLCADGLAGTSGGEIGPEAAPAVAPGSPSGPSERGGREIQEYYVKLKGRSYMHCCWLSRELIMSVGQKTQRGLLNRLKNFDSRLASRAEVSRPPYADQ